MPTLLDLEQQTLVRAWIQGVPLAALDLAPDYPALAQLAACRTQLHLKAVRLGLPNPGLWLQRRPEPAWQQTALQQLSPLLQQADLAPERGHPLRYWVAPEPAACLASAHLTTVGELLGRYHRDGKACDSAAIFAKACFGHPSPSKRQKLRGSQCLRRPQPSCFFR